MILDSAFPPGFRLSERELAAALSVSRTPVREALRRLVEEGIVTHEPGRGYRVASICPEQALHLFVFRETIEALAVRLVCEQGDPAVIPELEATIEAARAAADAGSLKDLIRANQNFHFILAKASGNPYVVMTFAKLQAHIAVMMGRSLAWPRRPAKTIQEHAQILAAIREGNARQAQRLMRLHIRRAYRAYSRQYNDAPLRRPGWAAQRARSRS